MDSFTMDFSWSALSIVLTIIWLKLRKKKVNFTSRVGIVLAIFLSWTGFCMGGRSHPDLTGFFLFMITANFCYLFIIDSKENIRLKNRLNFMRGWKIFELAAFAIIFIATPGYLIPLISHPVARIVMTILLIWQWLGIFVYSKPWQLKIQSLECVFNLVFLALFGLPVYFSIWLGPAIVSIFHG